MINLIMYLELNFGDIIFIIDTEGADRVLYNDIVFQNADGSSTRLVLRQTVINLNVPLAIKYSGTADVINQWKLDSVTTIGTKNQITINDNWRIDQQGTHPNGPNGASQPGVTWANIQLQYGGNSRES